jgi:hypothetical protein
VTEQVAVELDCVVSVQLALVLKLPLVVGLTVKLTEPVGTIVGAVSLSVTVAVQVVPVLASTVEGEQLTLVIVERAVILKLVLVAPVRPALEALRVYPVPALLIERSLKVATPADAVRAVVPLSVPLFGFVPIAIVT